LSSRSSVETSAARFERCHPLPSSADTGSGKGGLSKLAFYQYRSDGASPPGMYRYRISFRAAAVAKLCVIAYLTAVATISQIMKMRCRKSERCGRMDVRNWFFASFQFELTSSYSFLSFNLGSIVTVAGSLRAIPVTQFPPKMNRGRFHGVQMLPWYRYFMRKIGV
jgi:hypothetical protein